ncbi:MAG: AAA family ATPase, partial [Desulfovibrio sp.]|nr:AAA family ATPase [Desulfovibrio sp.]
MPQNPTPPLPIYIGGEVFRELRQGNRYYIDKTKFIEELLRPNQSFVSLITRPRRFGKTLTMTTLQEFFDIRNDSKNLFEGLAISKNTNLCHKWMNKYTTLFITFKDVKRRNFELSCGEIANVIQSIYNEHSYLQKSSHLDNDDKKILLKFKNESLSEIELSSSLNVLCRLLAKHY